MTMMTYDDKNNNSDNNNYNNEYDIKQFNNHESDFGDDNDNDNSNCDNDNLTQS